MEDDGWVGAEEREGGEGRRWQEKEIRREKRKCWAPSSSHFASIKDTNICSLGQPGVGVCFCQASSFSEYQCLALF